MNLRLKRLALPVVLIATGTYALIGCIPVPGSFKPEGGGPRPEERIGRPSSDKPLHLRRATREQVGAVLGTPTLRSADERVVVYRYGVVTHYVVWPLCFAGRPKLGSRFLRLEFNEGGTLERFKVYKSLADARGDDAFEQVLSGRPWPARPAGADLAR